MVEITNFRQGAILNHNHGVESEKSLKIKVEGISSAGYPVKINDVPAAMVGRYFSADVELTEKFNNVCASVMTPFGIFKQELVLVWDKKSFKRCNFYIDDHSFVFYELAKQRPARAFDHFYLKGLKQIHDEFGLKVTLNAFYHDAHHDFYIKDVPDTWKQEFIDNADWLKFSFHAYSEFPDRPYLESTAEEFGRDWDLVQNELARITGEETYIPPAVIHWANIHPVVAREMRRRGTRCYSTSLRARVMGGPSLADRMKGGNMANVEQRSASGADKSTADEGFAMHYDIPAENSYLTTHGAYYDPSIDLFFFGRSVCCCNLTPLADIDGRFKALEKQFTASGTETYNAASHEQYTFPDYPNYIPDHMERLREATRVMVEGGCKPVFFNDGILGNTAWDK